MTTNFKQTLLKEAGLLSISKSDCDLFLIAQANTITYRQLAATALHGSTAESSRFSLKRLENEGFLSGKSLPDVTRKKYYLLTAKGRKRIERLFGTPFLERMELDLERRPPLSRQQLPHRLHTGDLYFAYLSNPHLSQLPLWKLEEPYTEPADATPPPRCDGMLQTGAGTYFIEQDNCTQGEAALENKLRQYMSADCFLGDGLLRHALVFTLYAETRERPAKTPPYSVYRILVKAARIWQILERECASPLSFTTFCRQFADSPSPVLSLLSGHERGILENLCARYPDLSLEEVKHLKKTYLCDGSLERDKELEQDALFSKRLKQRFYPLIEKKEYATLQSRLKNGMRLYVLPNHRLKEFLPFSLQKEYQFADFLARLLSHMGLNDLAAWNYRPLDAFTDSDGQRYVFRNVFSSPLGPRIIAEDISGDLGARIRVAHYLNTRTAGQNILFLLFTTSRDDASEFLDGLQHAAEPCRHRDTGLCFLDKSLRLYESPDSRAAYFCEKTKDGALWLPAALDDSALPGALRLTERQV